MLLRQNGRHLPFAEVDPAFRYDVLNGLSIRPRAIPARWLYDRSGAELFEAITTLPEYYPTRTEHAILSDAASEIAALTGPVRAVVEFGSGSSAKTPILLSAVNPSAYVPIDNCIDVLWRWYSGSRTRFRISASILSRGTLPASCDSLQRSKACRGSASFPDRRSEICW